MKKVRKVKILKFKVVGNSATLNLKLGTNF